MNKFSLLMVLIFSNFCFSQETVKTDYYGFSFGTNIFSHNFYGMELGINHLHKVCLDNNAGYPVVLIWTDLEAGIYPNWKNSNRMNRFNLGININLNSNVRLNPSFGVSFGIIQKEQNWFFSPAPKVGICYNAIERKKPLSFNLSYRFNPLIGVKNVFINEIELKCFFGLW